MVITNSSAFSNIGLNKIQCPFHLHPTRSSTALKLGDTELSYFYEPPIALFAVLAAGILGFGSQSLISSMLDGDQGLRAFLSDGSGFNKSKFSPKRKDDDNGPSDPLPWLRLPKLDYVQVAGQEDSNADESKVVEQLEFLAAQVRAELSRGENEKASKTIKELNDLMDKYGFDYNTQQQK